MTLTVIGAGLVDGFNPCAMWVLLFLLSMLVHLQDRKRMALVAGTFLLVSGAVYYAFMAAWLNVFLLVGMSTALRIALGGAALVIGAINVKDFVAFHKGVSLSIPESAKPGIYARVRGIVQAKYVTAALFGAAFLYAIAALIMGVRAFWRDIGEPVGMNTNAGALFQAMRDAGELRYLD